MSELSDQQQHQFLRLFAESEPALRTFVRSLVMHPRLPLPYVEINTADAVRLGIQDGDSVSVSAGDWKAEVTARVDGRAPVGVALMPASLGPAVPGRATTVNIQKQAALQPA